MKNVRKMSTTEFLRRVAELLVVEISSFLHSNITAFTTV